MPLYLSIANSIKKYVGLGTAVQPLSVYCFRPNIVNFIEQQKEVIFSPIQNVCVNQQADHNSVRLPSSRTVTLLKFTNISL
jgi:hypothetical protein